MKNKVKILREESNMTQSELAEQSQLSLRTIQRIEAGNTPRGFTLKAIAKSLKTEPENLLSTNNENNKTDRAKLINLSALSGLILPFGGIIIPLILTYRTKELKNKELGKNIVAIQILLAAILSILMIISPFIQKSVSIQFPLFIFPLIIFIGIKVLVILKNGISLNQKDELCIKLKNNFL